MNLVQPVKRFAHKHPKLTFLIAASIFAAVTRSYDGTQTWSRRSHRAPTSITARAHSPAPR